MNKSHLAFIIQTEEGNMYGCYIETTIGKVDEWISDSHAFIFSIIPTINIYRIGQSWQRKFSFRLCKSGDHNLCFIGTEIAIGKTYQNCLCLQNKYCAYEYDSHENAIIGRSNENGEHIATRIVVLQCE